jgi:hypothetical protein
LNADATVQVKLKSVRISTGHAHPIGRQEEQSSLKLTHYHIFSM